jgi:hypothetical protein
MRCDVTPRVVSRTCNWRSLFCTELPPLTGPLAPTADSAIGRSTEFTCITVRWFSESGPGSLQCETHNSDTTVQLSFADEGAVTFVDRVWVASDTTDDANALLGRLVAQYGPSTDCQPSDEISYRSFHQWQVGPVTLGLGSGSGPRRSFSAKLGRVYCYGS